MPSDFEKRISVIRTRLCTQSPFFGALALFARVEITAKYPTAATDGRNIFFNLDFFNRLTPAEQEGVYLHEVLHAALLHVPRGQHRDHKRWNIAADIVVNGILVKEGYSIPVGSIRVPEIENRTTEEIYDLLQYEEYAAICCQAGDGDLVLTQSGQTQGILNDSYIGQEQQKALEEYWRNALEQASVLAETNMYGSVPGYLQRELNSFKVNRLNWRHYLWRFLIHTPMDFEGFDRRFVGRKLYLDALAGETVHVVVGVDTSGSIVGEQLDSFLGEVQGILGSYPQLVCDLYYVDAEAHGPFRLTPHASPPEPVGGGGTDFCPFFEAVAQSHYTGNMVAVYLTDGYGQFPDIAPNFPVLWVVTEHGLDLEAFPFGEKVRLGG